MSHTETASHPSLPSGPGSHEVGSVVDYLSRTGELYKQHVELLRQQQEAREMQAAPFRPTVTAYAEAAARQSQQRRSEAIGERLHHLHIKKREREQQQREQQQQAEAAAIAALPFAPRISKLAEAVQRQGGVPAATWRWQAEKAQRLAELQQQRAREEMAEVQAAPHISAYAHTVGARDRPRGMPVEDYLALKEERRRRELYALTELQWSTMPGTDLPPHAASTANTSSTGLDVSSISGGLQSGRKWFSPVISAHAARLRRPGEVSERLYRSSLASADTSNIYDEEYETRCTFQPALSKLSRQLSHTYYDGEPSVKDVPTYERLHRNPKVAPKYRKHLDADPQPHRLHQPQISELSRILVETLRERDPIRGAESPGSRLHRSSIETRQASLSTSDSATAAAAKKCTFKKPVITPKEREAAEETTFKPRVSTRSEALWGRKVEMLKKDGTARTASEARELLWRQAAKQREERVRRQRAVRDAGAMLECTFKPTSTRPPVGRPGYEPNHDLDVVERTALWSRQKEQRLAQLRAELDAEAEEVRAADCTFRPTVHEAYPLPRQRPQPPPGEISFLERQEEARRRRAEAERWWKPKHTPVVNSRSRSWSSSRTDGGSSSRRLPTAIESFSLGTARRAATRKNSHHDPSSVTRMSDREAYGYGCGSTTESDEEEDEEDFQPHYPGRTPRSSRNGAGSGRKTHSESDDANGGDEFFPRHQQPQQPQQPLVAASGERVASTWLSERRAPGAMNAYW